MFKTINVFCLKYKVLIIICLLILILSTFFIYYIYINKPKEVINVKENITLKKEETVINDETINVDIKGAVLNPGVYKMKKNDLIIDVIKMAGGLIKTSDTSITNLAYKVFDGLSFKIYTKEEVIQLNEKKIITEKCICPTIENNTCVIPELNNIEENNAQKISINKASKEELITLNGVGETTANKIILYREENGNFEKIEDIMNVSGIGESLFAKIKDFITI